MNLEGTTALVTGANRGIGAAIVDALLQAGAARIYAASRSGAPGLSHDARVVSVRLDVTSPEEVAAAVQAASDVQILVNNAGVAVAGGFLRPADTLAAEQEMNVNYFGTLRMSRAFAPVLAHNGGGAIVNVLSILARVNAPALGSYSASKAAAHSMTQALRFELAGQGTRVLGVLPAFVDTDMAKRAPGPKLSPAALGAAIVDALREGKDEIYPGAAAQIASALQHDPEAVARQIASVGQAPVSL